MRSSPRAVSVNWTPTLAALEPILDVLVRSSRRSEAERGLLEILLALRACESASFWRRVAADRGGTGECTDP